LRSWLTGLLKMGWGIRLHMLFVLWKKWAFFAVCGSAGVVLFVNLLAGVGDFSFYGLGGVAILCLVLWPSGTCSTMISDQPFHIIKFLEIK
jgi:hypothetical protein